MRRDEDVEVEAHVGVGIMATDVRGTVESCRLLYRSLLLNAQQSDEQILLGLPFFLDWAEFDLPVVVNSFKLFAQIVLYGG